MLIQSQNAMCSELHVSILSQMGLCRALHVVFQAGMGTCNLLHIGMERTSRAVPGGSHGLQIDRQEKHHLKVSFLDKFRCFLAKHELVADERYMWD